MAERLKKAVTIPPKPESLEKISSGYLTPKNAPEVCTPRVDAVIWQSISPKARSADVRIQKLQNKVVQGLIPYAEILQELHSAATENRAIDVGRIKKFSLDGLTLSGHASYELSMFRRQTMKPFVNQKYKGICSKNTPLDEQLFGKDLSSTLKNVAEAFNVGQKITNLDNKGQRRFHNRHDRRKYGSNHRHHDNRDFKRQRSAQQWSNTRAPATVTRSTLSPLHQPAGQILHNASDYAPAKK